MKNKHVKSMIERTFNKDRKNGFIAFGVHEGIYCAIEWGWTGNPPDDYYDYSEKMHQGVISLTKDQINGVEKKAETVLTESDEKDEEDIPF